MINDYYPHLIPFLNKAQKHEEANWHFVQLWLNDWKRYSCKYVIIRKL